MNNTNVLCIFAHFYVSSVRHVKMASYTFTNDFKTLSHAQSMRSYLDLTPCSWQSLVYEVWPCSKSKNNIFTHCYLIISQLCLFVTFTHSWTSWDEDTLKKKKIQFDISDAAPTLKFDQGQQNWYENVKIYVDYHHANFQRSRFHSLQEKAMLAISLNA